MIESQANRNVVDIQRGNIIIRFTWYNRSSVVDVRIRHADTQSVNTPAKVMSRTQARVYWNKQIVLGYKTSGKHLEVTQPLPSYDQPG